MVGRVTNLQHKHWMDEGAGGHDELQWDLLVYGCNNALNRIAVAESTTQAEL